MMDTVSPQGGGLPRDHATQGRLVGGARHEGKKENEGGRDGGVLGDGMGDDRVVGGGGAVAWQTEIKDEFHVELPLVTRLLDCMFRHGHGNVCISDGCRSRSSALPFILLFAGLVGTFAGIALRNLTERVRKLEDEHPS